jgi:hypothetical protein
MRFSLKTRCISLKFLTTPDILKDPRSISFLAARVRGNGNEQASSMNMDQSHGRSKIRSNHVDFPDPDYQTLVEKSIAGR